MPFRQIPEDSPRGTTPGSPDPWGKVGEQIREMQDQRTPLNVDPRTGRPYEPYVLPETVVSGYPPAPAAPVPPPNPRWNNIDKLIKAMENQRTNLDIDPRTGRPWNTGPPMSGQ